jgi:hypothetical protein
MITVDANIIRKKYLNALSELEGIHSDIFDGKLSFNYGNLPIKAKPCDYVRLISDLNKTRSTNQIKTILLSSMYNAEQKSPATAFALMNNVIKNCNQEASKNRVDFSDIEFGLKKFVGDGQIKDAVLIAIKEMGLEGKLSFATSVNKNDNNIVVKSTSKISLNARVHDSFSVKNSKLENCVVLYIDGSIHEMSLLESLTKFCYETKKNLILIAHNFADDVINTLNFNHSKNYYNLIPLVYNNVNDVYIVNTISELRCGLITVDSYNFFRDLIWIKDCLEYNVYIDDSKIHLESELGKEKLTEFIIPQRMMNISGLIEDRIASSFLYAQSAAKHGLIEISDKIIIPVNSYNLSLRIKKSFLSNVENLGCLIDFN